VTKDDRGTYYCVAENGVGRGVRRHIAVEVIFAPVVSTPNPKVGQALQYDTVLDCHVEAYPPPAIVWLINGAVLSNNQHYAYADVFRKIGWDGVVGRVRETFDARACVIRFCFGGR